MIPFLKRLWEGVPGKPTRDIPRTFKPGAPDRRVNRPRVFDPALLHYQNAYRVGEPEFADPSLAQPWREARRDVMDHVLRLISSSRWSDHLVLRGSLLLQAWLGDAARDPGDIDFTVAPHTRLITEPWASELFADLGRIVRENPHVGGERNVEVVPHEVATDDIWTYDRAPGKRLVFPWKADGLPGGFVQCDVVFGEQIDPPPTRTLIAARRGAGSTVLAASREQSLAWKILWLETDHYAQGKDLYDAALLAEQTTLPLALLERTLRSDPDHRMTAPIDANLPLTWQIDWDNFKLEYPHVPGDSQAWQQRLADALRRSFA